MNRQQRHRGPAGFRGQRGGKMSKDTIKDIFGTFNEKQRLVLYYIVGKAVEGEETILDVLDTFNEKQRLVLNYLVNKAVEDAKKGKTSESKNNNIEPEVRTH